jgi:hypothetical protein
MWSVPRIYKKGTQSVELNLCGGGVTLRVEGGDEKESLKSETVK